VHSVSLCSLSRRARRVGVGKLTFMYSSLLNKLRLGGWSNKIPCIRSRHARINRSFAPSFAFPISLSRQVTNLNATFHSNPSCSLKNSLNAGSSLSSVSSLRWDEEVVDGEESSLVASMDCRREGLGRARQICARSPSTWRRPLRILGLS
jgi:hypothetical protein